ncbi:MAG: RNA polymerase sigma factor [Bacteroidetes bacterium]|nr:RNA polymerase sigma factor [Bacteroidota bacterium]
MEIVHRYKEKVYYHIRRILLDHDDTDDAAQNTFIRVWENLGSFRNECALYSWIYRIATNEALTLLRKKRNNTSLEAVNVELSKLIDSGAYLSGDEIERKLQKMLLTLPDKQKLVFQLKYFEDLNYEQISEITGTSVGALKASYFHAVRKIEEFLKREI